MTCEDWFELVSAAADDQVSEQERARLDGHLATCVPCAALLARFEGDRRRARLQPPAVRQELVTSVLAGRADHPAGGARRPTAELARRSALAASVVAVAVIGLLSASASPSTIAAPVATAAAPSAEVLIDAGDHTFDSARVEVPAGTTIEWRTAGDTTHHLVRHLGGATVVEDLTPGSSESATFADPGTYEFWCTIHPEMTGSVTVDA
jgi:plastocyanin